MSLFIGKQILLERRGQIMNDEKSKTAMASEIIAEHENIITELNKHIKELNMDIFKIRSIFRAVHYSIISGAISDTEIGPAMSSIQTKIGRASCRERV